jgi:hypothetical protein
LNREFKFGGKPKPAQEASQESHKPMSLSEINPTVSTSPIPSDEDVYLPFPLPFAPAPGRETVLLSNSDYTVSGVPYLFLETRKAAERQYFACEMWVVWIWLGFREEGSRVMELTKREMIGREMDREMKEGKGSQSPASEKPPLVYEPPHSAPSRSNSRSTQGIKQSQQSQETYRSHG